MPRSSQLTLLPLDRLASPSPSPARAPAWMIRAATWRSSALRLLGESGRAGWFSRTCPVSSSDGGRDFGAFLGALGQCGYGFAYRILDAQYFGVAQRRRRVFVVGYRGDWRPAAAVLFEPESLGRDSPPCRETGQNAAATLTSGAGNGRRREDDINLIAPTLTVDAMGHTDFACNGGLVAFGGGRQGGVLDVATTCTTNTRIDFETETLTLAGSGVRRLTPRECERLQGFPDDFTRIAFKGKPASDAPRYRVLGNAMAVSVIRWILGRVRVFETLRGL
ncbi:MAG: DNA cytosine methyltransferase [Alphaproteobacteria bacterium]|nr:DNA cytosine methyltransferase [Alphaproteobacteria bacterium]